MSKTEVEVSFNDHHITLQAFAKFLFAYKNFFPIEKGNPPVSILIKGFSSTQLNWGFLVCQPQSWQIEFLAPIALTIFLAVTNKTLACTQQDATSTSRLPGQGPPWLLKVDEFDNCSNCWNGEDVGIEVQVRLAFRDTWRHKTFPG